jgi:transposase
MRELSEKKREKALRYKELLEKAEEAKKRDEKRKFSKECGVSISSLNRLKQKYDRGGFLGLIDKRNGNPNRNIEAHELVKKFQAAVHTGLQG